MMRHRIKLRVEHLFIMPSFNDFLGGRPLNETRPRGGAKDEMIAGPVLRSNAVNMENAEVYLLDGTFLGTLRQLAAS
jgi:metallophosphoesterase superfamily enzyme